MRMRFGDRLTVEVAVEPGVLDTRVPTFLLQPLAENAMRHGIEPLRGAGQVQIVGERRGDRVVLQVRDNGQPSQSLDTRSGIGLTNTEARLRQLYGPAASFSLRREDDRTVAEVVLPISSAA
jgi:LytS/YehU family sensor histidine kinase